MKVEKIDRGAGKQKWLKRQTSKLRRRLERRDLENAPTRLKHLTRGWVLAVGHVGKSKYGFFWA